MKIKKAEKILQEKLELQKKLERVKLARTIKSQDIKLEEIEKILNEYMWDKYFKRSPRWSISWELWEKEIKTEMAKAILDYVEGKHVV